MIQCILVVAYIHKLLCSVLCCNCSCYYKQNLEVGIETRKSHEICMGVIQ